MNKQNITNQLTATAKNASRYFKRYVSLEGLIYTECRRSLVFRITTITSTKRTLKMKKNFSSVI